jgi:hypothetical protein
VISNSISLEIATQKNSDENYYTNENLPGYIKNQSKTILNKFLFGHTFKGSFGLSIGVPAIELTKETLFPVVSIERKTMERIAIGLNDTVITLNSNQNDSESNEIIENYKNGFNSNICNSLRMAMESLQLIENVEVEFSMKWSPMVKPEDEILHFNPVVFSPEKVISLLQSTEKTMKYLKQNDVVKIYGKIINLTNDIRYKETSKTKRHAIKILGNIKGEENSDPKVIHTTFNEDDYNTFGQTHFSGNKIEVTGILIREKNEYRLLSPTQIKEVKTKELLKGINVEKQTKQTLSHNIQSKLEVDDLKNQQRWSEQQQWMVKEIDQNRIPLGISNTEKMGY